jgi:hypothetical protein
MKALTRDYMSLCCSTISTPHPCAPLYPEIPRQLCVCLSISSVYYPQFPDISSLFVNISSLSSDQSTNRLLRTAVKMSAKDVSDQPTETR